MDFEKNENRGGDHELARGRTARTPFLALTGVFVVVAAAFGLMVGVASVLYFHFA